MYGCMYENVCMYVCMYVCMHACMLLNTFAYKNLLDLTCAEYKETVALFAPGVCNSAYVSAMFRSHRVYAAEYSRVRATLSVVDGTGYVTAPTLISFIALQYCVVYLL